MVVKFQLRATKKSKSNKVDDASGVKISRDLLSAR